MTTPNRPDVTVVELTQHTAHVGPPVGAVFAQRSEDGALLAEFRQSTVDVLVLFLDGVLEQRVGVADLGRTNVAAALRGLGGIAGIAGFTMPATRADLGTIALRVIRDPNRILADALGEEIDAIRSVGDLAAECVENASRPLLIAHADKAHVVDQVRADMTVLRDFCRAFVAWFGRTFPEHMPPPQTAPPSDADPSAHTERSPDQ